ncbi:diguanylate cyclase [Undibacterium curvum]|uniref:sensor domain-containing diguanylate cyclase n=1 Tax=Undibacterium curvum TaxID=2762294 RepID=UPI003BF5D280
MSVPVPAIPSPAAMEAILNTISLGLIVVDSQQTVTLWNDWVVRHSGIEAKLAVGKTINNAFAEPPSRAFAMALANTLNYGLPVVLSNALHRSPLALFERMLDMPGAVRIHQSVTLTPVQIDGERCCLIQITDSTTSIKREKILRSHSELLKKEATTDGLTGIYNRRFFDEHFKMALGHSTRQNSSISIFMVDIDFFKEYNDFYGHVIGDKALIEVATTLKQQLLRASDVVARFGGEEFILMLPNMAQESAVQFAEKLRLAIWNSDIPHARSKIGDRVSISIGYSHFNKMEGTDPNALLSTADAALYEAKKQGRNRCFYKELPQLNFPKPGN